MTWCARCDVLTMVDVGDPCPACGVPALDTNPVSGKVRSPSQVLELEEAPVIHIADAVVETAQDPIEAGSKPIPGRPVMTRLRRHSRVIAFALTAALIGVVYIGTRPDLRRPSKALPTATPSVYPGPGAVLGEPANGWALFALEHHFTLLDLATGVERNIEVAGSIQNFAPSPRGGRIAYTDEARILYIITTQGEAPVTIASEVNTFSWTQDGEALVVGRSQTDERGAERMRIELIGLRDRTPLLLSESALYAGAIISSGFAHLVTLYENDTPSVFDLQPGSKPRLIRKNATLLDASADGRRVLLATNNGLRLIMLDMKTKKARRIGPERFLATAAKFAPDGQTAAINGTTNFALESGCEDAQGTTCTVYPFPADQTLWSLDVKTLEMRSIRSWPGPEFASPPVWGPNGWIFMVDTQRTLAISITEPSKAPVEFKIDFLGLAPKYLP